MIKEHKEMHFDDILLHRLAWLQAALWERTLNSASTEEVAKGLNVFMLKAKTDT